MRYCSAGTGVHHRSSLPSIICVFVADEGTAAALAIR